MNAHQPGFKVAAKESGIDLQRFTHCMVPYWRLYSSVATSWRLTRDRMWFVYGTEFDLFVIEIYLRNQILTERPLKSN